MQAVKDTKRNTRERLLNRVGRILRGYDKESLRYIDVVSVFTIDDKTYALEKSYMTNNDDKIIIKKYFYRGYLFNLVERSN